MQRIIHRLMLLFVVLLAAPASASINPQACSVKGQAPGRDSIADDRFSAAVAALPADGYTDSIFINSVGDRVYFTHSILTATDFMGITTGMPHGALLQGQTVGAGLDYNTDLYYIEWNGTAWSAPINLGGSVEGNKINSLGNECCVWLNDSETEIVFYRDSLDIPALGQRGTFRAVRPNRHAPWETPVLLSAGNSSDSVAFYQHENQRSPASEKYFWENKKTIECNLAEPESLKGNLLTSLFATRMNDGKTFLSRTAKPDACAPVRRLSIVKTSGAGDSNGFVPEPKPISRALERLMRLISGS